MPALACAKPLDTLTYFGLTSAENRSCRSPNERPQPCRPKARSSCPREFRETLRWNAGTRLAVESTADGVLLKPLPVFVETRPEDVFGSLPFEGVAKSPEEMDAGVREEARRRHAGN